MELCGGSGGAGRGVECCRGVSSAVGGYGGLWRGVDGCGEMWGAVEKGCYGFAVASGLVVCRANNTRAARTCFWCWGVSAWVARCPVRQCPGVSCAPVHVHALRDAPGPTRWNAGPHRPSLRLSDKFGCGQGHSGAPVDHLLILSLLHGPRVSDLHPPPGLAWPTHI